MLVLNRVFLSLLLLGAGGSLPKLFASMPANVPFRTAHFLIM
jgi:hypothetical protein